MHQQLVGRVARLKGIYGERNTAEHFESNGHRRGVVKLRNDLHCVIALEPGYNVLDSPALRRFEMSCDFCLSIVKFNVLALVSEVKI
jgi:hypothetical protein